MAHDPILAAVSEPLLRAWSVPLTEHNQLYGLLIKVVSRDELCRRFMAIRGVGPVTAETFKAAVDELRRFRKSRTAGVHFGPTSRRIQSVETIDFDGHISRFGAREVRTALNEAASPMLVRSKTWCSVRAWGLKIARRPGHKRAVVAVARKLASVMHAMWRDGTEFSFQAPRSPPPPAETLTRDPARIIRGSERHVGIPPLRARNRANSVNFTII